MSSKWRIGFHVVFVGVGLCSSTDKRFQTGHEEQALFPRESVFLSLRNESVYMVYCINRWPQIHICKVLRFALVIRWIDLRTVGYMSSWYLIPSLCLWSDHSFRMRCSRPCARELYVFWYHSFLIRPTVSFKSFALSLKMFEISSTTFRRLVQTTKSITSKENRPKTLKNLKKRKRKLFTIPDDYDLHYISISIEYPQKNLNPSMTSS